MPPPPLDETSRRVEQCPVSPIVPKSDHAGLGERQDVDLGHARRGAQMPEAQPGEFARSLVPLAPAGRSSEVGRRLSNGPLERSSERFVTLEASVERDVEDPLFGSEDEAEGGAPKPYQSHV